MICCHWLCNFSTQNRLTLSAQQCFRMYVHKNVRYSCRFRCRLRCYVLFQLFSCYSVSITCVHSFAISSFIWLWKCFDFMTISSRHCCSFLTLFETILPKIPIKNVTNIAFSFALTHSHLLESLRNVFFFMRHRLFGVCMWPFVYFQPFSNLFWLFI